MYYFYNIIFYNRALIQKFSSQFDVTILCNVRSRVQKFLAWPTFQGDRNKTTLPFFNLVSLYFNTLFNWYINLTIDGTIYPSQHFPLGAAFVCQAGKFWTLLPTSLKLATWVTETCRRYTVCIVYFHTLKCISWYLILYLTLFLICDGSQRPIDFFS